MNQEKALNMLRAYRDELEVLRSRLARAEAATPFSDDDNKRYHHICLKLKDFAADSLMDNRRTSFELVRKFTQSMSDGKPRVQGMDGYREAVDDLIERIEATPFILRKTPTAAAASTPQPAAAQPRTDDATTAGAPASDAAAPLEQIAKRFHLVERQLREHATPVSGEDEYQQRVQNLFHALLLLHFEHVEKEQWTPAYTDDGTVISFYLPDIRTVAEITRPAKSLGTDDLKTQLSHHIEKHNSHPECDAVRCFIYDPVNRIHDHHALERALNTTDGDTRVDVRVIPRD